MGQEVKNPLRAQSKYGLMGSSAKTGEKIFWGSPEHFLDKNDIWDRTPPQLHINCSVHVWGRVQGSQIFKRNSIISMSFLVISLSPWSPRCPHFVPVVPTSSPCRPRRPHIIPRAPRRSPCGLHGCGLHGLRCLRGLHPMLSPWSPCCPRCPHVVPVVPMSSPCCPRHPHVIPIAPRRSPCGLHGGGLCCLRGLHSMLSPWSLRRPRCSHVVPVSSPHHLEGPHIIPNPPDTHSTHPYPLGGWGAPNQ